VPGFSLFTDNHVRGDLIKALRQRGWDVSRAVDVFGQENDDAELLAHAAKEGRVFLTCDEGIQRIVHNWLQEGRTDFRMIYCAMEHQQDMTVGELLAGLEAIGAKSNAFAYQVEYLKPQR
jgi:PIN like domain